MNIPNFQKRRVETILDKKQALFIKQLAKHDGVTENREMEILLDIQINEEMERYKNKNIWDNEKEFDFLFKEDDDELDLTEQGEHRGR